MNKSTSLYYSIFFEEIEICYVITWRTFRPIMGALLSAVKELQKTRHNHFDKVVSLGGAGKTNQQWEGVWVC